jgi:hypothetical protein
MNWWEDLSLFCRMVNWVRWVSFETYKRRRRLMTTAFSITKAGTVSPP